MFVLCRHHRLACWPGSGICYNSLELMLFLVDIYLNFSANRIFWDVCRAKPFSHQQITVIVDIRSATLTSRSNDHLFNTQMFKSLHGCAPSYLSDACKSAPEASRRSCLSGAITCVISWSRTHLGDRSFDVAGPRLWNKLPVFIWQYLPIQKTVENVSVCQWLGCGA